MDVNVREWVCRVGGRTDSGAEGQTICGRCSEDIARGGGERAVRFEACRVFSALLACRATMKTRFAPHAVLMLALCLLLIFPGRAAGGTCMAETKSGKVVTIEIEALGTVGMLKNMTLTIHDKDGKLLLEAEYEEASQFAEVVQNVDGAERHVVVFRAIGERVEVLLSYVGKGAGEVEPAEMKKILKDPKRKKEAGNSLYIWDSDTDTKYEFSDLVFFPGGTFKEGAPGQSARAGGRRGSCCGDGSG